ncbi:hypothetical protein TVAG_035320 [Trichomonas vaginalis G3]|uniref:Uncharacterized protein n=1 Tax=Trichomonas vaginalis (strain ATCC PRA-98 / G3) TaxID=412133 RepID=A2DAK6_TRIV3|nr:hypothetical protein TVAGG3_0811500 [Trichomonas vaginalis G3]EAY22509.1 hypothetical protein TVAG_035320 [Trichomonas vaginalis G3]KAI5497242.1 hypothetical protein TVAGG3_0811500 [Trichomonas vaginalis G3]|eukprot:XP_001583495.1 hypothetical protein [Trichomonas vaginalis G3]
MCKEDDSNLPPRTPKGLPPPGEKPMKPEDTLATPNHKSKLTSDPNVIQNKEKFEDAPLSDITDSQN